jgi:uncharacterized membrane protein YgcG
VRSQVLLADDAAAVAVVVAAGAATCCSQGIVLAALAAVANHSAAAATAGTTDAAAAQSPLLPHTALLLLLLLQPLLPALQLTAAMSAARAVKSGHCSSAHRYGSIALTILTKPRSISSCNCVSKGLGGSWGESSPGGPLGLSGGGASICLYVVVSM